MVNKHIYIVLHIVFLSAVFHSVASYLQLGSQDFEGMLGMICVLSVQSKPNLRDFSAIIDIHLVLYGVEHANFICGYVRKVTCLYIKIGSLSLTIYFCQVGRQLCLHSLAEMQCMYWVLSTSSTGMLWQDLQFIFWLLHD